MEPQNSTCSGIMSSSRAPSQIPSIRSIQREANSLPPGKSTELAPVDLWRRRIIAYERRFKMGNRRVNSVTALRKNLLAIPRSRCARDQRERLADPRFSHAVSLFFAGPSVRRGMAAMRARLRMLCHHRCCIHPPRHDPHHAQAACCKPLVMNPNLSDRL